MQNIYHLLLFYYLKFNVMVVTFLQQRIQLKWIFKQKTYTAKRLVWQVYIGKNK